MADSRVAKKAAASNTPHTRSRSGCHTCRLRRKKCDETKPICRACKHLGIECDYKRPTWWSQPERRKQQKEMIKELIKRTQQQKPSQKPSASASASASLSSASQQQLHQLQQHQRPPRARAASVDSSVSPQFSLHTPQDLFTTPSLAAHPHWTPVAHHLGYLSPYDIDIRTERQMFVNDVPTHKDSTLASFSGYPTPLAGSTPFVGSTPLVGSTPPTTLDSTPLVGSTPAGGSGYWFPDELPQHQQLLDYPQLQHSNQHSNQHQHQQPQIDHQQYHYSERFESHFAHTLDDTAVDPLGLNIFDFAHPPMSPEHRTVIEVHEGDRYLLDHFLEHVAGLIFPVFDRSQFGDVRSDVILPALESNRCYQHCCLSIAAMHLKATGQAQLAAPVDAKRLDEDIMRHRFETVSQLCQSFGDEDAEHSRMLEATLSLIFFQATVATPDDGLLDIPWHQHFQGAVSLVESLGLAYTPQPPPVLPSAASSSSSSSSSSPSSSPFVDSTSTAASRQRSFNMTLASWIDIIGATVMGRVPVFADLYRERVEANVPSGLAELMGCDDRVMYLISEIACLDALRGQGMDQMLLCSHIEALGRNLSLTEQHPDPATAESQAVRTAAGATRPRQLSQTMTDIFRVAARIYLCSLVPGFDRAQPAIVALVDHVTDMVAHMPAGPDNFDRSLVWPLLMTGAASLESSAFRTVFADRAAQLGHLATFGSFGRTRELLADVWALNDALAAKGERATVHWRDVMQQKGWDFLLI